MRIAQIGFAYDADVADPEALLERYATLTGWAEAIAAQGHESAVVHRFRRRAEIVRHGVRYVFVPGGVIDAVAAIAPDIAHVNGLGFPVSAWWLRKSLPRTSQLIVQDHASGDPVPRRGPVAAVRDAVKRRAMGAVDAFFFVSERQASEWRRRAFIHPRQPVYEVLEGSTSMTRVDRARARHMTGISGSPALLWVGRLNANKDPLTVLEAFERVASLHAGATLTMAYGDAELEPEVRVKVALSDNLTSRVRLVGRLPHPALAMHYSAADLFVLGSHHESCGFAVIEACACGLTPIVTDIPPFRAITGAGSGDAIGALWRVGDAASCADAILRAASADADEAAARVQRHFARTLSWPAVARAAIRAYGDVLSRAARGPA
jgi:glycosyltransferase involved in cell wall biosynthesis